MSGSRRTVICFGLVLDLSAELDAAGVRPENAPSLEQAVEMCWPLAKQLARLEKRPGTRARQRPGRAQP